MPQRTNEFQQLVHMVQMAFAPTGAKVSESVMEHEREIDILIEAPFGLYHIKIAVEAKDTKRPLDVQAIEQLIGRYKTLGGQVVDKVVVVSRNGYTQRARACALAANIELFVLNEVTQSDWTKLAAKKLFFRNGPYITHVELSPPVPDRGNQTAVHNGRFICTCHGDDKGSPLQWAEWMLRTQVLGNSCLLERIQSEAKLRGGVCGISIPLPLVNRALRLQGYDTPVQELRVHFQVVHAENEIEWTSYKYEGKDGSEKTIDQFESSVAGSKIKVVFPDGPTSSKLALRIDKDHNVSQSIPSVPASTVCVDTVKAPFCPKHYPSAKIVTFGNGKKGKSTARSQKNTPNTTQKKGVDRNAPCPCGSGKKYKVCCIRRS